MIRKSLIASAVIVGGTLAFTSGAKAQTAAGQILMTGTVKQSCTFTDQRNGTLTQPNPNALTTDLAGQITANCTGRGLLTVQPPVATKAPQDYQDTAVKKPFNVGFKGATPASVMQGTGTGLAASLNPGATTLSINMDVQSPEPLPAGDYEYTVNVTATGR